MHQRARGPWQRSFAPREVAGVAFSCSFRTVDLGLVRNWRREWPFPNYRRLLGGCRKLGGLFWIPVREESIRIDHWQPIEGCVGDQASLGVRYGSINGTQNRTVTQAERCRRQVLYHS